jgi:hypothetical protein
MGRNGPLSVLVSLSWLANVACSPGPADTTLTVRIHAEPGHDSLWVTEAEPLTARIFERGGMSLRWIDCTGDAAAGPICARELPANEFIVRIRARRDSPGADSCGRSIRPTAGPGHYVTLFDDCIADVAGRLGIAQAVLGSHMIAHEIGHLLLPIGHAPVGIMRAELNRRDWDLAVNGALGFTADELRQLVEELRRRLATAEAAGGR